MKSRIFLIDIDGVACAHAKAICTWVNKKYGMNSKMKDVTSWNHNFGPITFVEAVNRCYCDEDFILKMEVTPGFHKFLKKINSILIAKFASVRKNSHAATRLWIENKFGNNFEVIFTNKKTAVSFDYLVDDNPEEVIFAAANGKTSFLLNQPWNNNDDTKSKLKGLKQAYFVQNFSEIIDFFNTNL